MTSHRDVLELLRDSAVHALDESWDIELPSTLVEREWVAGLRSLRTSLRGTWSDLGLDVLLRGPDRAQAAGLSDARIFGEAVDAFLVGFGMASAADEASADAVATAASRLLDRKRYRDPELAGPATHAGIDVVRAAHRLLGMVLADDELRRIRELTAYSEALEWDIHDRQAWEESKASGESGRTILERLPLFRGLRPRRRATSFPEHEPLSGPHVNVAILAATGPAEHRPRVEPGSRIWLAVSVGQDADDALLGALPPHLLPKRVPRELVDVVVLADTDGDEPHGPPAGQLRISSDGPFAVTRPSGIGPLGRADSRRLYFALRAPEQPGDWSVRCLLAVRGVVVHVEQVTVVVGESELESTARTAFRLVDDLAAPEALAGCEAPTLALCASECEGTQSYAFLLADEDGIAAAQVRLPSDPVAAFVDAVRGALDEVTWVTAEPSVLSAVTWHSWNWVGFGAPSDVANHLIALARAGRPVLEDLESALERFPEFAVRLRETLQQRGSVQLAVEQDTTHVLPVQFLYDFPVRPAGPLSVCDATTDWLVAHADAAFVDGSHDVDEPPCVAGPCPQEGDDSRVCIAGFWGFWHRVSSDLASATALSVP